MEGQTRPLGWLIFAGVAAVGGTAFLFVPSMNGAYVKPDQAQMRAYRVSELTDGQLIALHEKSVVAAGRSSRRRETRPPEHGEVRLGNARCARTISCRKECVADNVGIERRFKGFFK